jgi:MarR family transcriptional regulator, organic hydroperoxide resistance regulator
VSWCPGGDRLDQDIFDAMTEFITQLMQRGERLADRLDVPVSCMKAIRRLDPAVTMKDLGQRLHCDPSFVTMIADALEQRGLAKREPNPADRRIKNLVLTPRGVEIKAALEHEALGLMPWTAALSTDEREQLLGLIRKMNDALAAPAVTAEPAATAEEVNTSSGLPVNS